MAGKRALDSLVFGVVLGLIALDAAPISAERLPVTVRVEAKNARGVERRIVRDVQGRWETDGSFTGAFQVGGGEWSVGGYGSRVRRRAAPIDRRSRAAGPGRARGHGHSGRRLGRDRGRHGE